jgi:hypothetical protein
MNNTKTLKYILYAVTLSGTLFSGYLSGVKFFNKECAFGETCPLFFGMPACYVGFLLFLTLFILSTILVFKKNSQSSVSKSLTVVAFLGFLFSGYYVLQEVAQSFTTNFDWSFLGLSTCAYGFVFFTVSLVLSYIIKKNAKL